MKTAEIKIESMKYPNIGIGYLNNKKIEIKRTLPDQKVLVQIRKNKGRLIEVLEKSPDEIESPCPVFGLCGGCSYQNLEYDRELQLKEQSVKGLISGISYEYLGIEQTKLRAYRNKMEYSFGDLYKNSPLSLGLRKRNSYYEIAPQDHCNIVDKDFIQILNFTQNYFRNTDETFYHKGTRTGALRHLVIRKGHFTGEILVNLVTTGNFYHKLENFTGMLKLNLDGKITGIIHTLNDSVADVVRSDSQTLLCGRDFFYENLHGLKFKIYPYSFFQTNSFGANILYNIVKDFVIQCENRDEILDLYCGSGTIGQIISPLAGKVTGIDIAEQSIASAKENARENRINNIDFIRGDIKKISPLKGDIVIADPPREGLVNAPITDCNPRYIIYVSCNPATFVKDLANLKGYRLKKLKLADMFPRTAHVEIIGLLEKEDL